VRKKQKRDLFDREKRPTRNYMRAEVVAALEGMLRAPTAGRREVEVRLGRLVDGKYAPGLEVEEFERVLARLRSFRGWSAHAVGFTRCVHFGDVVVDVDSDAAQRKQRNRSAVYAVDGTAYALRLSLSTETDAESPVRSRRKCVETAVRAKHRESFEYKGKLRLDCTRSVTATVHAATTSAPRCASEVEIEAVGDVAAESMLLKAEDVLECVAGRRPAGYTAVPTVD
jgi:hypothetical protein